MHKKQIFNIIEIVKNNDTNEIKKKINSIVNQLIINSLKSTIY